MNDDEGEGQEDPEREHEHGARQVDDVVAEVNFPVSVRSFAHTKLCLDIIYPTAKTMNV